MAPEGPPRETVRVPFSEIVELSFPDLQVFVREYAANLSLGGMFLRTREPRPVGAAFQFRCKLPDEFVLLRGEGQVVWVREADEAEDRPAGMGVRFLSLDRDSRDLIFRVVDRHIQKGGEPFDLERSGT